VSRKVFFNDFGDSKGGMPLPEISSYRGSWGERSCPRGAMALHSVSINWTHNLPIVRRTLYHWAIVITAQSSSPKPRCQVMCGSLDMTPHVNKWSQLDGAHE